MAARVITVTSGKGGVGKTTATANLAVALASLGNKVCCIDADIGLRNLDIVLGLENRIVYDLVDVVEGRAKLRQAMIKDKRVDELYLIPAAQTRDKTAVSPSDMIRICDELRTMVDFIIIDSPAGIERGFRNAVAPADMVIIVTNPEVSSVRDADRIIGLIEAEGKGPAHLVLNRIKLDMVKRGDMLSPDDVIDILAIKLIGLVPEDEGIVVASNRGTPASLADESRAGKAFRNIARRIMGENVPFMPLEENTTWTQRLLKVFGIGEKGEKPQKAEKPAPRAAPAPEPRPVAPTPAPVTAAPTAPAAPPVAAAATNPVPAPVPAPPPVSTPAPLPVRTAPSAPAVNPAVRPAIAPASPVMAPATPPATAPVQPAVPSRPVEKAEDKPETKLGLNLKGTAENKDSKPAEAKPADSKEEAKAEVKENSNGQSAGASEAKPIASSAGTKPGS